ncbi:MAG: hypothetical protein WCS37_21850, partial [Chloroflexota bacterium]
TFEAAETATNEWTDNEETFETAETATNEWTDNEETFEAAETATDEWIDEETFEAAEAATDEWTDEETFETAIVAISSEEEEVLELALIAPAEQNEITVSKPEKSHLSTYPNRSNYPSGRSQGQKWIAVLSTLLLLVIALNLFLYLEQQTLSQEVVAGKQQLNRESQARVNQATAIAEQKTDLASTVAWQKSELGRIQKLLTAEQENARKLAQSIGAEVRASVVGSNATPAEESVGKLVYYRYRGDLESMNKELTELQAQVNNLKQYAASLEKNLSLTDPAGSSSDPTSTPQALSVFLIKNQEDQKLLDFFNSQLLTTTQNLATLGDDVQNLLLRYGRIQAAAEGVARSNTTTYDQVPGPRIVAAVKGSAAEKLAALSYAPRGWPVRGPITSPFGPRPNIFGRAPQPSTPQSNKTNQSDGRGGDTNLPATFNSLQRSNQISTTTSTITLTVTPNVSATNTPEPAATTSTPTTTIDAVTTSIVTITGTKTITPTITSSATLTTTSTSANTPLPTDTPPSTPRLTPLPTNSTTITNSVNTPISRIMTTPNPISLLPVIVETLPSSSGPTITPVYSTTNTITVANGTAIYSTPTANDTATYST